MNWRRKIGIVSTVLLATCEGFWIDSETASSLYLHLTVAPQLESVIDRGTLYVEDAGSRVVHEVGVSPGGSIEVSLPPGTYTVASEGFRQGLGWIEGYAERSGVGIQPEQTTEVRLDMQPFLPTGRVHQSSTRVGEVLQVTVDPIPGASYYEVGSSASPVYAGSGDIFGPANPIASVNFSSTGTYYLFPLAITRFQGVGVGRPLQVTVGPRQYSLEVFGDGTGAGTVTSTPPGIDCAVTDGVRSGDCAEPYDEDTQVALNAAPTHGSEFEGWEGPCAVTQDIQNCRITMDVDHSVHAGFEPTPEGHLLTVSISGDGDGSVTSSPAGIDCTRVAGGVAGECSATFASGTTVTLTQNAIGGSTFGGWNDSCTGTGSCQVTMDQPYGVTAHFDGVKQTLTVSGAGSGQGTVTSSPTGIDCMILAGGTSGACTADYLVGTVVTLTTSAAAGSGLEGWSGDCAGSAACQITMDGPRSVVVDFGSYMVTVRGAGSGKGIVLSSPAGVNCDIRIRSWAGDCSEAYPPGVQVSLIATPDDYTYAFYSWHGSCQGAPDCQVTTDQAHTVVAHFESTRGCSLATVPAGAVVDLCRRVFPGAGAWSGWVLEVAIAQPSSHTPPVSRSRLNHTYVALGIPASFTRWTDADPVAPPGDGSLTSDVYAIQAELLGPGRWTDVIRFHAAGNGPDLAFDLVVYHFPP